MGKAIHLARLFQADDAVTIKERTTIRQSDYVAHLGDHIHFQVANLGVVYKREREALLRGHFTKRVSTKSTTQLVH